MKVNYMAGLYHPYDDEAITIDGDVRVLTESRYKSATNGNAKRAIITVETAQIRYRVTGDNPSSSVGHLLNADDVVTLVGIAAIANFKATKVSSSGAIYVTYER